MLRHKNSLLILLNRLLIELLEILSYILRLLSNCLRYSYKVFTAQVNTMTIMTE